MTIKAKTRPNFSALDSIFFIRAGIALLSVSLLAVIISRVVYPFDTGNAESLSWIPAGHLLAGANPYSFAFAPPYSMTPYGIVYYALIAAGVKFFGLQIWFGRILSIGGFAVCVFSAAKITKKLTANKDAAVLATCLAILAMFSMQMWIALMRSDLIAAGFAAGALCLAFTLEEKDKPTVRRVCAMILLAALAFFTKHTFSLPAGFIFLRLMQIGKHREAFYFAAAFAAVLGAGIFLLDYTSSGGYIWQHFVHARDLPFISDNWLIIFPATSKRLAFLSFLIFPPIFFYRKRGLFAARGNQARSATVLNILRSPKFLILIYFAISFLAAFVSSGRVGANVNYYIENSFVASIICGLLYDWFRRDASPKIAFALCFLLTCGGAFQLAQIARGEYFRWQSLGYYREIFRRTGELTAQEPNGACVSVSPDLVVWNGCALEFVDFEEYSSGWSPELTEIFEREAKAGRFAAIIWFNDELQARFPNYRLVETPPNPSRFPSVFLYERADKDKR